MDLFKYEIRFAEHLDSGNSMYVKIKNENETSNVLNTI